MKILVLSNFGMGLYRFRKELLETLIVEGNEIYISMPKDEYVQKLESLGCRFIETYFDRRGTNPIKDLKLLLSYVKMIKTIQPDVVLTYTVKPNVYGGIACRITKVPYIANITGLGVPVENRGVIQKIILELYRVGLKNASCVFFQNESNRVFFIDKNIVKGSSRLIPGSGVNLNQHKFEEYPKDDGVIRILFIGRIMKAKGVDELFEAAKKVKEIYANVQFELIGWLEEDYSKKLAEFENLGIIKYHGQQEDVHFFIKRAHAIILPSYHEGTSNVLLESASTGRPVLASMVPGCQETFDEGVSGFGFEVRNVNSIFESIIKFIQLPYEKKKAMGIAGRKKVEKEYDRQIVINAYIEEINKLHKHENR